MTYIKQLDSLRAIAVLLVIISHWLPDQYAVNQLTRGNNGAFGVNIFFVLSGFLITWILLESKKEAEKANIKKTSVIKRFFIRRTLRIFPVYYLTIFFLFVFHHYTDTSIRENFAYFFTYTANFYFYKTQQWDGMVSHLWSLSVEEQFYLFWPWLILYCKKPYLTPMVLTFIAIGIGSNYLLATENVDCFTTACFDAFGLGGLLALWVVYKPETLGTFYTASRFVGIACLLFLGYAFIRDMKLFMVFRFLSSCVALWAISYVVLNRNSATVFDAVLNNSVLIGIGKISYGLYLYHLLIPHFVELCFTHLTRRAVVFIAPTYRYPLVLTSSLVLVFVCAFLSWKWIEKPFLRLKKHFELLVKTKAVVN